MPKYSIVTDLRYLKFCKIHIKSSSVLFAEMKKCYTKLLKESKIVIKRSSDEIAATPITILQVLNTFGLEEMK